MRRVLLSLIVGVTAVAASIVPALGELLIDRIDAATRGEPWRYLTGHLVHASRWHLLFDLALFVPLGIIVERRYGTLRFALIWLTLALGVAAGVRLLHDGWTTYAGLSGVIYGLIPIAVLGYRRLGRLGAVVVAFVAAKSAFELWGEGWLVGSDSLGELFGVRYLAGSHVAGLAVGFTLFVLERLYARMRATLHECPTTDAA